MFHRPNQRHFGSIEASGPIASLLEQLHWQMATRHRVTGVAAARCFKHSGLVSMLAKKWLTKMFFLMSPSLVHEIVANTHDQIRPGSLRRLDYLGLINLIQLVRI